MNCKKTAKNINFKVYNLLQREANIILATYFISKTKSINSFTNFTTLRRKKLKL